VSAAIANLQQTRRRLVRRALAAARGPGRTVGALWERKADAVSALALTAGLVLEAESPEVPEVETPSASETEAGSGAKLVAIPPLRADAVLVEVGAQEGAPAPRSGHCDRSRSASIGPLLAVLGERAADWDRRCVAIASPVVARVNGRPRLARSAKARRWE